MSKNQLLVKHWRGVLTRFGGIGNIIQWQKMWYKVALEAKLNNKTLLVFEVPNDSIGKCKQDNAIQQIEELLQEMYPE